MKVIPITSFMFWLLLSGAAYGQDTLLVPTDKLDIRNGCFVAKKNGLITSKEEFESNILRSNHAQNILICNTYIFPTINFSINNLLWFDIEFGGSYPEIETYLYKIPSLKKYLFVIKTIQEGKNTMAVGWPIFIKELTKKFEPGYTFDYIIKKYYK